MTTLRLANFIAWVTFITVSEATSGMQAGMHVTLWLTLIETIVEENPASSFISKYGQTYLFFLLLWFYYWAKATRYRLGNHFCFSCMSEIDANFHVYLYLYLYNPRLLRCILIKNSSATASPSLKPLWKKTRTTAVQLHYSSVIHSTVLFHWLAHTRTQL